MTTKLGMLMTLKRWAIIGSFSVSTFITIARPDKSAATFFTSGAAMRQGPHQAAQKSISTGTRAPDVISSKVAASGVSMGSFTGGRGDLHDPHRPVSAR